MSEGGEAEKWRVGACLGSFTKRAKGANSSLINNGAIKS